MLQTPEPVTLYAQPEEAETLDPCDRCSNESTRSYFRIIFSFGKFDLCRHHFLEVEDAAVDQGAQILDYSKELLK